MTRLTTLIKTPGQRHSGYFIRRRRDAPVYAGQRRSGCRLRLSRGKDGLRLQLFRPRRPVPPCHGRGQRGNAVLFCPQPHHQNDQRYYPDSDDRRHGPADAHEGPDHGRLGHHQDPRQKLDALGGNGRLRCGNRCDGAADHVQLPAPVPSGAEKDRPDQPRRAGKSEPASTSSMPSARRTIRTGNSTAPAAR